MGNIHVRMVTAEEAIEVLDAIGDRAVAYIKQHTSGRMGAEWRASRSGHGLNGIRTLIDRVNSIICMSRP